MMKWFYVWFVVRDGSWLEGVSHQAGVEAESEWQAQLTVELRDSRSEVVRVEEAPF